MLSFNSIGTFNRCSNESNLLHELTLCEMEKFEQVRFIYLKEDVVELSVLCKAE